MRGTRLWALSVVLASVGGGGTTTVAVAQDAGNPAVSPQDVPLMFRGTWDMRQAYCDDADGSPIIIGESSVTIADESRPTETVTMRGPFSVQLSLGAGERFGEEELGFVVDEDGQGITMHGPGFSPVPFVRCSGPESTPSDGSLSAIPAEFQGQWFIEENRDRCSEFGADLIIKPLRVQLYELSAALSNVSLVDDRTIEADGLYFDSEGSGGVEFRWSLGADRKSLIYSGEGFDDIIYVRC